MVSNHLRGKPLAAQFCGVQGKTLRISGDWLLRVPVGVSRWDARGATGIGQMRGCHLRQFSKERASGAELVEPKLGAYVPHGRYKENSPVLPRGFAQRNAGGLAELGGKDRHACRVIQCVGGVDPSATAEQG